MPKPKTVGDVWQFTATAGWVREDIPLFSEAGDVLNKFRTAALKGKPRRNMRVAEKIRLRDTDWGEEQSRAWETIKNGLLTSVTTSYRDRRKKACLFSDASTTGWAYAITQCDVDELDKPWEEQRHELLAVNSGKFRNSQVHWGMPCKEAYPIRHAVERHRRLLEGNVPFASVNDHKSLTYVLDEPARKCVVSVAARDRLRRWAEYLRSFAFDTVHIPGAKNHFCDLLSRNGCSEVAMAWEHGKAAQLRGEQVRPQMAIITPRLAPVAVRTNGKDMNVSGSDLMPQTLGKEWPTPERLRQAQQRANIVSDVMRKDLSVPLYTDVSGRVLLHAGDGETMEVLAVCHQGDWTHRSMKGTIAEFRRHFKLHGMGVKAEEEYIRGLCRRCLSCIKTKTGSTIPRPMWYMVYATRPFEYIHLDFVHLPDAVDGKKYLLVITDDFSLTTVLHACESNDADTVVKVLLEHWLSHYPDPELMHSDGGSHFDNQVVKKLASVRGWKHTICTPYAKWAHGVAEHNNKEVLKILRPLCRQLDVEVNKWPSVIKLVQSAMNRQRRQARGGMSPIELTTGIKPVTAAAMLYHDGVMVEQLDEAATLTLQETVRQMARHMEGLYDAANVARRAKSEANRKKTSKEAIPDINIGDFVLYAKHKPDSKLDYTWVGPAVVTEVVSPLVLTVRPYTLYDRESFDVHISRVRRFAGKDLHVTEELQRDIEKDHPDNIVGKIVDHKMENGTMYLRVRWKGFTAEMDTWQDGKVLFEDAPSPVADYLKARTTNMDDVLRAYKAQYFPSLDAEEQTAQLRRAPGAVAAGRRKTVRRRGRTLAQVTAAVDTGGSNGEHGTRDDTTRGREPPEPRASDVDGGGDVTTRSHTDARTQRWKRRAALAEENSNQKKAGHSNAVVEEETWTVEERQAAVMASRASAARSTEVCGWQGPTEADKRLIAMLDGRTREVLRTVAAAHWVNSRMSTIYSRYDFTMGMARWMAVDQGVSDAAAGVGTDDSVDACDGGDDVETAPSEVTDEGSAPREPATCAESEVTDEGSVPRGPATCAEACRGEVEVAVADTAAKDDVGAGDDDSAVDSGGEADDAGETNSCGVKPSTWREKARPMFTLKTEVRPSSIPGAGMGLWLVEDAIKGERLAIYTGEVIDATEAASRTSAYMWKVNKKTFVDAEKDLSRKGRYVNDGGKSGKENNARMSRKRSLNVCKKTGVRWTGIVASKNIKAPAEIFMSYGKAYVWPEKKVAPMMMVCGYGYMECGEKEVDGGADDGAGGDKEEMEDVMPGEGATNEEDDVATGGGGTVTSGARAGGGVAAEEEDGVTMGGDVVMETGSANPGGGVAATLAGDMSTGGGDVMKEGVQIGGGVTMATGGTEPGGGAAATRMRDVTTGGGDAMTDDMLAGSDVVLMAEDAVPGGSAAGALVDDVPTGGGVAVATEGVAPGGGDTGERIGDMVTDGNRAAEGAAKDDEETADEEAGDEQRVEDGVVLSWLEQVGKQVVGAGVVRVMPKLMRAMKAFIRVWTDDEED
jgi:hypothetical protein